MERGAAVLVLVVEVPSAGVVVLIEGHSAGPARARRAPTPRPSRRRPPRSAASNAHCSGHATRARPRPPPQDGSRGGNTADRSGRAAGVGPGTTRGK